MSDLIALVDWDGTIRKGFTLPDWVDYLAANCPCGPRECSALLELFDAYHQHRISHDKLADLNAEAYHHLLCSVRGNLADMAADFVQNDMHNLIPGALDYLRHLTDQGYQVHIISGAPKEVLSVHLADVPLHGLYTLDVSSQSGGEPAVRQNPGVASMKRQLSAQVLDRSNARHVVALGNSASDLPMLEAAHLAVVVDNTALAPQCGELRHITSQDGYLPLL